MFSNDNVCMGEIPMKTLEAWANRDERIVKLREDEAIIQKACTMWEAKSKNRGVPASYIESIKRMLFKENFKRNFMISMARGIVEEYFNNGKTADELLNCESWRQQMVESAVDTEVSIMVETAESMRVRGRAELVAIVLSGIAPTDIEDEEGNDDDADSGSVNDEA